MPWFPDFVGAVELVRRQTRAAGLEDPVAQYLLALTEGDADALETVWPGEVLVFDPYAGDVRGHKQLRAFVKHSQAWLADRLTSTEIVASTLSGGRAVVEVLAHLADHGTEVLWPVAVVAESPDERSVVFRTYCSQWPVVGSRPVRAPILEAGPTRPGDVVGRYQAALDAGDTDAIVSLFAPEGYVREPIGPQALHHGASELRAFFSARFRAGGIGLELCGVTDDSVRCAVEYNCVRWGGHQLPPQAGIAVFERGRDGLLAAARMYDDVEPALDR
jgi:ketosteroid isomerase-like protein